MSWDNKLFQFHLETRRFGREMVFLDEVDSTNTWLAHHYEKFSLAGSLVIADHQTDGKGRQGRIWYDQKGKSLLISIIIKYPTNRNKAGFLSLLPAIALADVIKSNIDSNLNICIKWPNDVLINDKKIAGVLGQSIHSGDQSYAIIGMGINLYQEKIDFDDAIEYSATSLKIETSLLFNREILLANLLNKWEPLYDHLIDHDINALIDAFTIYSIPFHHPINRTENGNKLEGKYIGIGVNGQLILEDPSGKRQEFYTGDIEFAVSS